MSIRHAKIVLLALIAANLSPRARAAGFGLYEASARGNAMGGALVGDTVDASANYYNPANLTSLAGTHTLVGATVVHPVLDITANGKKSN